jgi:hypothetical protein
MPELVPDIYCDSILTNVTPYDCILQLHRRPSANVSAPNQQPEMVGCVRISLEQAKAFAIMLTGALKQFEGQQCAAIPIHPQIRISLGISKNEDW